MKVTHNKECPAWEENKEVCPCVKDIVTDLIACNERLKMKLDGINAPPQIKKRKYSGNPK